MRTFSRQDLMATRSSPANRLFGNFDSEVPLLICKFFSQILGTVTENHFLFFRVFVSYLSSLFRLIHLPPSPFEIFSFNYLSWWFDLESSCFFSTEGIWCFWAICPLNLLNKFLKEVGGFWQQFLNKGPSISFSSTPQKPYNSNIVFS